MHLTRRYSLLFVAVALSCCTAVRGQTAPEPDATLPDIVAEVNGQNILKAELLPGLAPDEALRRAIDRRLVEQQAKKEGITDNATTRQYMATMMLANHYQQKTGASAVGSSVTTAEIDAYIKENRQRFHEMTEERRFDTVRGLLEGRRRQRALGQWLIAHLENFTVSINGDAIAQAVFDGAIEAAMSGSTRERETTRSATGEPSTLYGTIRKTVLAQAADDANAKELLRKAVLQIGNDEFVLGRIPAWQSIDFMPTDAMRDVMLITTVRDYFLAAEARAKRLDKDPEFLQERDRVLSHMAGAGPGDLVDLYYRQHGISDEQLQVTAPELKGVQKALVRQLMSIGKRTGTDAMQAYLQTLKSKVAGTETALDESEFEAFYEVIVETALGTAPTIGDPVLAHLQAAKLRWAREPHLQMLREQANITIHVN